MGNMMMTIYCVARSSSLFRSDARTIGYFDQQFLKGNQLFSQAYAFDNLPKDLQQSATERLFDNGRKLLAELTQLNSLEILQESELIKSLFPSKREHIPLSAVELVQEKMRDLVSNNSLVSSIVEAGDYLTATTKSLISEAEDLSNFFYQKRDHALANATEFWKTYCENHSTLETLHCLVDDFVLSHMSCEGLQLFSEYVWTMRPQLDEGDLIVEANNPQIDDDAFHFIAEVPVPRRSVLFVGQR